MSNSMTQAIQLPPSRIRFSHDSIHDSFSHPGVREIPILETLGDILNGYIDVDMLPMIRVVLSGGKFFVLSGNRRLYIYRTLEEVGFLSSVEVMRCPMNDRVWQELDKKLTTKCMGETVDIRTRDIDDFLSEREKILESYSLRQAQNNVSSSDSDETGSESDTSSSEDEEPEPSNEKSPSQQRSRSKIEELRSHLRAAQADCSEYYSIIERYERKIADLQRKLTSLRRQLGKASAIGDRAMETYDVKKMDRASRRDAKQRILNDFVVSEDEMAGSDRRKPKCSKRWSTRQHDGPTKRERKMTKIADKTQQTIAECKQRRKDIQDYQVVSNIKVNKLRLNLNEATQNLAVCRAKIQRYRREIQSIEDDNQEGEIIHCIRDLFVKE
ncbi:Hypp4709 [Branchiostoma lanceolatum]|uniref:Hypp4709 protein n=1 Tax=Branchiostoma lanceolatum TaxID=7740 RepID=A0A8K0A9F2_BRALA|nr:Hypp4709 [Branchiostoma lanceolatum]